MAQTLRAASVAAAMALPLGAAALAQDIRRTASICVRLEGPQPPTGKVASIEAFGRDNRLWRTFPITRAEPCADIEVPWVAVGGTGKLRIRIVPEVGGYKPWSGTVDVPSAGGFELERR